MEGHSSGALTVQIFPSKSANYGQYFRHAIVLCGWLMCCLFLSVNLGHSSEAPNSIYIAYPTDTTVIQAPSSFIVGAIPAGHTLTCNGETVRVNEFGFFAHVIPLRHGANRMVLNLDNGQAARDLVITREPALKAIREDQLAIGSIEPSEDIGVKIGETISFVVRATPKSKVVVRIGNREIELDSAIASKTSHRRSLNKPHGQSVAYGEVYGRQEDSAKDLYRGSYRIALADHFRGQKAVVTVSRAGESREKVSNGGIWTVLEPSLAQTKESPTVVRLGPGLARTTPLDQAVSVQVDGWIGKQMRCQYAPDRHVWIDRNDLTFEGNFPEGKTNAIASAPRTIAHTINIINSSYGQSVRIPLEERVPYQVEQRLSPNSLILRIYGVTSDTDWITAPAPEFNEKSGFSNTKGTVAKHLIDHVDWKQPSDNQYEVVVHLSGARQWGYKIHYDETTLCLDVKQPVTLAHGEQKLAGVRICLDPGHGGAETGAIGCSGKHESEINLAIALKLKEFLEKEGAQVILTRLTDSVNPSLDERVKTATDSGADFLLSVHNNALPDGRDPWKEHGTSAYWYHPQSIELAKTLNSALVTFLAFGDMGARYQNLALARPTAMPAVLVEVGFMINPDEYAKLIDSSVQAKAAEALCDGFLRYLQGDCN
jgi:N-acetylmuramoyl-L-alanine amidase